MSKSWDLTTTKQDRVNQLKNLQTLDKKEQRALLKSLYYTHNMSWHEIAQECNSYANKIRRKAAALGLKSRTRGEAQSVALKTGRHEHPTEGTQRPDDVKHRIGDSMTESWKSLSEDELNQRKETSKELWDNKTPEEQKAFIKAGGDAVRKAAKEGSKLELFLLEKLGNIYTVEHHKEHFVVNERLEVDLYLPELRTAIEVDGPSHFKPVWGEKTLVRNKKSDRQKNGLLLALVLVIIRVIQDKPLSETYKRNILKDIVEKLCKIDNNFPPVGHRQIVIKLL